MSTRAGIKIDSGYGDAVHLYRHCDGFPEDIIPDIIKVINDKRGSWSPPERGLLAAAIVVYGWPDGERLPHYEVTTSFHSDLSFRYTLKWDRSAQSWHLSYKDYGGEDYKIGHITEDFTYDSPQALANGGD